MQLWNCVQQGCMGCRTHLTALPCSSASSCGPAGSSSTLQLVWHLNIIVHDVSMCLIRKECACTACFPCTASDIMPLLFLSLQALRPSPSRLLHKQCSQAQERGSAAAVRCSSYHLPTSRLVVVCRVGCSSIQELEGSCALGQMI